MEDASYLDGDESQLGGEREFRPTMKITVDADFDNPVDSLLRANTIDGQADDFFAIPEKRKPESTLTPADLVKFVRE